MTNGTSVADRLKELGIDLPPVPQPLAIYGPAVRSGNYVYISGQLPTVDGKMITTGRLGAGVSIEDAKAAARVAAINALAAANTLLGSLEGCRVIRTVGMVACAPEFTDHPQVVNGASEVLRDVFGEERGIGVRLAYGIASLPLNSPVEVELLLEVE
ncbi:MAG: RidA family protein [Chloroflexi bacterium]|nr:RidA family protein [Chloroflexota bacterium]